MQCLRPLDALHLDAAIRFGVGAVLTYDQRPAKVATATGFDVIAPRRRPIGD